MTTATFGKSEHEQHLASTQGQRKEGRENGNGNLDQIRKMKRTARTGAKKMSPVSFCFSFFLLDTILLPGSFKFSRPPRIVVSGCMARCKPRLSRPVPEKARPRECMCRWPVPVSVPELQVASSALRPVQQLPRPSAPRLPPPGSPSNPVGCPRDAPAHNREHEVIIITPSCVVDAVWRLCCPLCRRCAVGDQGGGSGEFGAPGRRLTARCPARSPG